MSYKCVCFDFDGTLADTEQKAFDIYNEMAEKYKYKKITHEELMKIKELTIPEIMEIIDIPFYKVPRVLRDGKKRMKEENEKIQAFKEEADLYNFVVQADALTDSLGIVTSNTKRTVHVFLENYKIDDYFKFVICSSLTSKEKKLKKMCRKLKIQPQEMLYVGDETRDIIASHKAGVDVVAVDWGYNTQAALAKCHPEYEVNSLEEIICIIKEKNGE